MYYDFSTKTRKIIYFVSSSDPDPVHDKREINFSSMVYNTTNIQDYNYPINSPHSSAFVDIHSKNGNSQNLEFWLGIKDEKSQKIKYWLKEIKNIDDNFGLFSISDINNDGFLDIIFPIKNSSPPEIFIAYNQKYVDYDWTKNYCESLPISNLNNEEKLFEDFKKNNLNNVKKIFYFKFSYFKFTNQFVLTKDQDLTFFESSYSPLLIRIGDLNLDSYPDILTVMKNKTDNTKFFRIIMNTPLTNENKERFKNSYFDSNQTHKYINIKDVEYISFFDLDENGQLDLLINRKIGNEFKINAYFNVEAYDGFFLKTLTTKSIENFFSHEIGTNYRYYVTDLKGERNLRVGVQHSQTSGMNLELPYSFMGIGPSYNYVENFHVISTSFSNITDSNVKMFTPIIPNSQLLVYNYNVYNQGNIWELDLIVTPISKLLLVVVVILVILAVLLIFIIILHCMEKVRKILFFYYFFLIF